MSRERPRVLLIDDDRDEVQLLSARLTSAGYEIVVAATLKAALAQLAVARPRVVITDLPGEGAEGLSIVDAINRAAPSLPVIVLTAHGSIPEAVEAMKRGVFEFLAKPFDGQVVLEAVAEALRISPVAPGATAVWRSDILTRSPLMEDVLAQAERVANTDSNVCIHGPSGAGKELLARAIHFASTRARAPFVAVNCGAIPEGLLESELFGHKKGAFTGAMQDRRGLFQSADGGTLLLDEVGDMPGAIQVKLLRALEERAVRPVGANEAVDVDVRIISATHRKLEERIAAGAFREDLYYRLNVVKPLPTLAPDAMALLIAAPWPGNVRQLLNVVEQAAALAVGDVISAELIRQALGGAPPSLASLDEARRAFERDYLIRVLKITEGNVTHAARLSGRNRTEFYRLLDRHGLAPAMFKRDRAANADTPALERIHSRERSSV
jgi:two-component system response regulator GlrR